MTPAAWLAVAVVGLPVMAFEVRVPGGEPVWVAVVAPEGRWRAFLDRLFTHFDRDGNGHLSTSEAARVFPLPRPDGVRVVPPAADRGSFRLFYRQSGFAPAVVRADPPTPAELLQAAALFKHLDRDADGALSDAELRAAPTLLRRLDADEDEVLTYTELLPPGFVVPPVAAERPPAVGPARGSAPAGWLRTRPDPTDPANGVREAGRFVLAQLREAVGSARGLPRSQVGSDPALAGLRDVFAPADRDGDGVLTADELAGLFDLLAAGASCQTVVVVADGGRSVFAACDVDRDGRLDRHELATLADRLPPGATAANIPRTLAARVGRGPVSRSFGPLTLSVTPTPLLKKSLAGGPDWFRAMDRNGDGFLSPAEFLGPPAAFRKMDVDGDGRVSAAEASAKD